LWAWPLDVLGTNSARGGPPLLVEIVTRRGDSVQFECEAPHIPSGALCTHRSRATVDALIGAKAHVLAALGRTKFTTNEVGRVAGVSIASLYEYIPDNLAMASAICTAISTRHWPCCPVQSANQRLHRVPLGVVPWAAGPI